MNKQHYQYKQRGFILAAFLLYLAVLAYTIAHHELWGDEIHSWNLAKASNTYASLIANIRYEGHPPLWHTLLWLLSRYTHQVVCIQVIQFIIAAVTVYIVLFRSPIPLVLKLLIPFGYFFLFEYGVLSRNYMIGVLMAFLICALLQQRKQLHAAWYYGLLFLLTMSHMLGVLLAGSLHLYYLLQQREHGLRRNRLLIHAVIGVLVALPAIYIILPPPDSQTNYQFWVDRWNTNQLMIIASAPVKSLLPIPAWWNPNFWNTQFLFENGSIFHLSNTGICIVSLLLISLISFLLRNHKKCLSLFLFNLLLTCVVAIVFPLTSTRYAGYIYISFIVAVWLMFGEGNVTTAKKWILSGLLVVQLPGAVLAVAKDIMFPFSNAGKVTELIQKIPKDEMVVSDYWCLNNLVAFAEKPFYCLEVNRTMDHILWDQQLSNTMRTKKPYTNGANKLFSTITQKSFYLISTNPVNILNRNDTAFTTVYRVEMIDKREGSIEKSGNIYLYKISIRP